jgi:hypothetical protein
MKRTELACYALIASAFALGGLLLVQLANRGGFEQQAQAEMAVSRNNITVLTAKTRNAEEALFVLENFSQRMLIFTVDLTKRRLELAYDPISLDDLFGGRAGGGGGGGDGRRSR